MAAQRKLTGALFPRRSHSDRPTPRGARVVTAVRVLRSGEITVRIEDPYGSIDETAELVLQGPARRSAGRPLRTLWSVRPPSAYAVAALPSDLRPSQKWLLAVRERGRVTPAVCSDSGVVDLTWFGAGDRADRPLADAQDRPQRRVDAVIARTAASVLPAHGHLRHRHRRNSMGGAGQRVGVLACLLVYFEVRRGIRSSADGAAESPRSRRSGFAPAHRRRRVGVLRGAERGQSHPAASGPRLFASHRPISAYCFDLVYASRRHRRHCPLPIHRHASALPSYQDDRMMFAAVVPKPRVTWLVDSNAPTAIATMAVRRAIALRDDADSTVLALHCPISTWPAASPLASIRPVCQTHELTDDPEVVVTSSPQTLAWADQHIHADIPRVHFLPTTASAAMANETFMMRAATLARLCVAPGTDTARVAEVVGLPAQNVQCHDDFTLAEQVILSSATNPVIVAIGALTRTSGLDVLIQGFALARDHLPRWQLRIYGRGPLRGRLEELIREQDIGCAVHLMGYAFDPSVAYAEASVAAHLATRDSSGLPLYEALSARRTGARVPFGPCRREPRLDRAQRNSARARRPDECRCGPCRPRGSGPPRGARRRCPPDGLRVAGRAAPQCATRVFVGNPFG